MDTPDQLSALPDSLFETSAVADFTGEISLPEIRMGADSYRFEEPLRYHLFFTNTGGALLATGEVSGQAKTACARCLDEVELDLEAPIEAYFVLPGKDEPLSEDEEVEYDQLIDKNKVDLTALFQVRSHLLCRSWCFAAKTAPVFALNVALTSTTKPAVVLRSKKSIRRTRLRCSRTTASILKSNDCSRTSCESLPFGQNRNFDD